ncbi:RidA family protein [Virgibacillus sp. JSM 102003]|uniref:RidA family protein n=1 Tax=Virgibacillus sp. JSM 102003 TaxID=1562108 RepID=UPI0035C01E2C
MRKKIITKLAPPPAGSYSQGISVGNRIYVAGQTPVNVETGEVPKTIEEQTRQVLRNVKHVLEAANASMEDIVKVTTYLTNLEDFEGYNNVYKEFFSEQLAVRTTIGCELKDIPLEIDVIAEID